MLLCAALPAIASATSYQVDDVPGLRDAVAAANANPGHDEVVLEPGTYDLSEVPGPPDNTNDVDIFDDLTIRGAGPGVVLDPKGTEKVLHLKTAGKSLEVDDVALTGGDFFSGAAIESFGDLTLDNVDIYRNVSGGNGDSGFGVIRLMDGVTKATIRNSRIHDNSVGGGGPGASGYGIINVEMNTVPTEVTIENTQIDHNKGSENGPYALGTIKFGGHDSTSGTLNVIDSTISDNVLGTPGMGSSYGAGISFRSGAGSELNIDGSTFARNWASGGFGFGGAIDFAARGGSTMHVTNSTFTGNRAGGGVGGGNGYGAAFKFEPENDDGTAVLINDTIVGNEANVPDTVGSAGFDSAGGTVQIGNTILAGNLAKHDPDCWNDVPTTSLGHNIVGVPGTCALAGLQDKIGVASLLAGLADNGGPTETMSPLPGSPAIDGGDAAICPSTDQRGMLRPSPSGGSCDIGAVESEQQADGSLNQPTAPDQSPKVETKTKAPTIGGLEIVPSSFWPVTGASRAIKDRRTYGTSIRFSLSRAALVRFRIERRRNAGSSRFRRLKGSLVRSGKAGPNSIRFSGRLRGKALREGSYRLVIVAFDGGQESAVSRARFRIRG
jgi:hypothetical protein